MPQRKIPIDATIDILTPGSISFEYQLAGPIRRLAAFLIDLTVCIGPIGILTLSGTITFEMMVVLLFVLECLVGILLEIFWHGQTIGKRFLRIRVLSTDGQRIAGRQAIARNLLRFVDMFPMVSWNTEAGTLSAIPIPAFTVGFLATLTNSRFMRVGDLVCRTIVVAEDKMELASTLKFEDPRVAQLAQYIPPAFVVSRTMAQSLATYAERRLFFSAERRREIARYLGAPLNQLFGFPLDTSHDLLLLSLHYRTFTSLQSKEAIIPGATFGDRSQTDPTLSGESSTVTSPYD